MKFSTNHEFPKQFVQAMQEQNTFPSHSLFCAHYDFIKNNTTSSFSNILALRHLHKVKLLKHQVEACHKVIHSMNGRAILADGVGLGKTIEAGVILKEYLLRGLVKKVLILVPASLINQWVEELSQKFSIYPEVYKKGYEWKELNIAICSIDTAKQEKHRKKIHSIKYDLLIVDEAHKLKNSQTKNHQFVKGIQKKYCLLLTATPIQNTLCELTNLIDIVQPELLSSKVNQLSTKNDIKNDLRKNLNKVMVRSDQPNKNISQSKRNIIPILVEFSSLEKEIYSLINRSNRRISPLAKTNYLRLFCSSKEAFSQSFMREKDTIFPGKIGTSLKKKLHAANKHVKGLQVIKLIQKIGDEKVVVFTEYRATQIYLQYLLHLNQISSVPFQGDFSPSKKSWMLQLFKTKAQVLITTEAGSEGLNL